MTTLTREQKAERIAENFTIYKSEEGYKVPSERDPQNFYVITKTNGRIQCNCPDFLKHVGENGFVCKHIQAAKIAYKNGLIKIEKNPTSQVLEYKFRPDQVKSKNSTCRDRSCMWARISSGLMAMCRVSFRANAKSLIRPVFQSSAQPSSNSSYAFIHPGPLPQMNRSSQSVPHRRCSDGRRSS